MGVSLFCLIPKLWLKKLDVWGSCVIVLSFAAAFSFVQAHWWKTFPPVDTTHYLLWSLPLMLVLLNLPLRSMHPVSETSDSARKLSLKPLILKASLFLTSSGYAYLVMLPLEKFGTLMKLFISLVFAFAWQGITDSLGVASGLQQDSSQDSDSSERSIQNTLPNWLRFVLFASVAVSSSVLFFFGSSVQLAQQAMILAVTQVSMLILFWRQPFRTSLWLNTWILSALWLNSLLFSSAKLWYLVALMALLSPLLLKVNAVQQLSLHWQKIVLLLITLGLQIALLAYVWSQQGADLYLG